MKFTRKGYGKLTRDGVQISQHTVAEEAYERAAKEGPGNYLWQPASVAIEVEAPVPVEPPVEPPAPVVPNGVTGGGVIPDPVSS